MAVDAFLKLDGIDGDSADRGHEKWIEISSFSWGVQNPTTAQTGSGAGSGRVAFQDFHFVASFNKSSPVLFRTCASGQHIKSGVLSVRKAGEEQQDFYKIRMTDVIISSYQSGGASDVPMEQVSMNYAKIEFLGDQPTTTE